MSGVDPFAGSLTLKYKYQLVVESSPSEETKSQEFSQKISGFALLVVTLTLSNSTVCVPSNETNKWLILPNSPFARIALANITKASDLWLDNYPLFNKETLDQYGLTKENINDSVTLTKDEKMNSLTLSVSLKADAIKNLKAVNDIKETFSGWFDFNSKFTQTNVSVAKVAGLSFEVKKIIYQITEIV